MRGTLANGAIPSSMPCMTAVWTSCKSGSPAEPGSLVRSSTPRVRTVAGKALRKAVVSNGRYRRTVSTPTLRPSATSLSTVARTVETPEPIRTVTCSAWG